MKVFIDKSPLETGHALRGIGQYTRLLVEAIGQYTRITLVDDLKKAEVIHYPYFDLFYLTLPLIKTRPTVVTIHDIIPLLFPKAYPKGIRGSLKLEWQKFSLQSVGQVVTDSVCSTRDVITHLKLPSGKVKTVYLAPNPRFSPASKSMIAAIKNKYRLDQPYFLYVGDINYNKNLPVLLRAFSQLPTGYLLVMVSQALTRANPAAQPLWHLIDQLGIENNLRILTKVPTEPLDELSSLYSGAYCYVQPSLYEGFGLPVLEAQACECPVMVSTRGSLNEVSQGSGWEIEPTFAGLTEGLKMAASGFNRSKLITLGLANIKRFSWQKTAEEMELIYAKMAK